MQHVPHAVAAVAKMLVQMRSLSVARVGTGSAFLEATARLMSCVRMLYQLWMRDRFRHCRRAARRCSTQVSSSATTLSVSDSNSSSRCAAVPNKCSHTFSERDLTLRAV